MFSFARNVKKIEVEGVRVWVWGWGWIEYFYVTHTYTHTPNFLLDTKSSLPHDVYLCIEYRSWKKVNENFTRDAARNNRSEVNFYIIKVLKEFQNISKILFFIQIELGYDFYSNKIHFTLKIVFLYSNSGNYTVHLIFQVTSVKICKEKDRYQASHSLFELY